MSNRLAVPKMYKLYIGGKFTRTESERYLSVINPKTKEKICNISRASRKDIRNAVVAARSGYNNWSAKTGYERGQILYRLAEMLEGRKDQIANELVMGSAYSKSQAIREVNKAIDRIIWYAGLADKYGQLIGSVNSVQSGYFNFSIAEPTGVVGILLPEELPFLSLISRICAVITSGNSCIIIASEISATSDIPAGVINILTGFKKELIPYLASHMDVNAFDYADSNSSFKKDVQAVCANNVKRFIYSAHKNTADYYNDDMNENIMQVQNFTELKTVWHTMGL